jgi:hypothetical protein
MSVLQRALLPHAGADIRSACSGSLISNSSRPTQVMQRSAANTRNVSGNAHYESRLPGIAVYIAHRGLGLLGSALGAAAAPRACNTVIHELSNIDTMPIAEPNEYLLVGVRVDPWNDMSPVKSLASAHTAKSSRFKQQLQASGYQVTGLDELQSVQVRRHTACDFQKPVCVYQPCSMG